MEKEFTLRYFTENELTEEELVETSQAIVDGMMIEEKLRETSAPKEEKDDDKSI